MYWSSPFRSALNMCAGAKECHHPHPTPPHPTLSHVMCARVTLGDCVYLWLQSVCAGDSGKWRCAHVTPVCVRGWLWVEKMMQNCACVYLWLQSVCAGDPLTQLNQVINLCRFIMIDLPALHLFVYIYIIYVYVDIFCMHVKVALRCFIRVSEYSSASLWYAPYMYIHVLLCVFTVHFFCECAWVYVATWVWQAIQLNLVIYNIAINACEKVSEWQQSLVWLQAAKAETCFKAEVNSFPMGESLGDMGDEATPLLPMNQWALKGTEQTDEVLRLVNSTWLCHLQKMQ